MCNYHRIHWENKVPGWFMLCIFPKPELKTSKPPKLNHQSESFCFQTRGATHGEKHWEGLYKGAVCSTAKPRESHPPLQQKHSTSCELGLDYKACIIPALAVLPLVCGQWEFCPCFQCSWNLPLGIGRGLKFAAGKAPRRCTRDGAPALPGETTAGGHGGEAEVSLPHSFAWSLAAQEWTQSKVQMGRWESRSLCQPMQR